MSSDVALEFWTLFRRLAGELATAGSADVVAYDALLAQLQRIDPGLWLEFSAEARELIVTADGNRSLFPIARRVVAEAPSVPGWTIRALKPQLGFPRSTTWKGRLVPIADVSFVAMPRPGSDELGLRLFVRGIADADVGEVASALLRALDHGLGEERFAESIRGVEVRPWTDESARGALPLRELDAFLRSREAGR